MAESRGSLLAKSVQKHAGRAKEKILQNLGKVDRTADEIFDEHLQNFTKQQNGACRFQKEFSNYIRCIRAAQAASKSLLEAIGDTYEPQWSGHDVLYGQLQSIDMLWQDFSHKLADQVLLPMNTYQSQFQEMRKKIDKRGRKLVDYDSQRHSFQALQTNMKKRDDVKMSKARESLEEAKRTYEMLNSELHDELPALYDSRILFFVTNLQSLFNAEQVFHSEASKVYGELESIVDKLATDSQRGSYSVKKTNGASLSRKLNDENSRIINNVSSHNPDEPPSPSATPTKPIPPASLKLTPEQQLNQNADSKSTPSTPPASPPPPVPSSPSPTTPTTPPPPKPAVGVAATVNGTSPTEEHPPSEPNNKLPEKEKENHVNNDNKRVDKKVEELYDIPVGATTDNLPAGVLYRVKATYKYNREDMDELSFDVGEIIQVVEYDDPEEQEEGWLMGIKETTMEKGMFPANFTRPL